MSKDEFDFLDPSNLFRFPFTRTSLQWGVVLGAMLSCHKYSRTRKFHLGNWKQSTYFGSVLGFLSGSAIWAYNMFQFTKQQHVLRQQSVARQEAAQRNQYMKHYFKDKFKLYDLSDEQVMSAVEYMDNTWKKLEAELNDNDQI